MYARKMAAQFAAQTWYEEKRAGQGSPNDTARFVRENWALFLPIAHEGWGQLLLRIAGEGPEQRMRRGRSLTAARTG
jgi:hypothetical protein